MVKYKITFDFDIEKALNYDDNEQYAEIEEIDDSCFDNVFDNKSKIKEFEDSYNEDEDESNKIEILDIIYDKDGKEGILDVTLTSELSNDTIFASELVNFLFEEEWPTVYYHIGGTSYEDYWDYNNGSPEQRTINVDADDSASITSYKNVNISKI